MEELLQIANDYRLQLVEDAAESLGSLYNGQHTGTFGLFGTLSFNGNKTITTGGGGAILTNNSELARQTKHLTTTAKLPHRWDYIHDEVGYNYRLPNLNAALGCAQLEQLPNLLLLKRALLQRYRAVFQQISEVEIVQEPADCRSNYWLQTLKLTEMDPSLRNKILRATNDAGLMTRPVWKPLHTLSPYRSCPRSPLPVTASLEQRLVNLPSSAVLL
jgi:dTDP-4-amino-4,6-dideoxygalactose transaminase